MTTITDVYRLKGEDATAAAFRSATKGAEAASKRMSSAFRSAFGAISAVAVGRTLSNWNKQAIDQADALATLAESFGVSTEEMSRFDYVAKQTNTTLEQLVPGLTAFQKNLVLAGEDSGRAQKALKELNLDANYLTRIPLPRQLEYIAEAFRGIENPAERVRISAQLFGDEVGRRMIPILNRGSEGLRALAEESDRVGNTLTKEVADKLQATDAAMKQVEAQSLLLKRELALGLGPAVVELGKLFNTTAAGVLNFGEALARALHGADEPAQILQDRLAGLANRRNELLKVIRQGENSEASAALLQKWQEELTGVEASMNRVNLALQQLGRDAQAYENSSGDTFKPLAASAKSAESILRDLMAQIRATGQGVQGMDQFIGPSLGQNSAALAEYFRGVNRENIQATERTVQLGQAFEFADERAEGMMATLKDELARRSLGTLSDLIYGMGRGAGNFGDQMLDAFRRIMADQAARQFIKMLSGLGSGGGGSGFLSAIASGIGSLFGAGSKTTPTFKGFAADGMSLRPGEYAIAGEGGKPEAVFGGSHGAQIVPFGKGDARRNVTIAPVFAPVIHIDSRSDRAAVRQDVEFMMRSSIGEYHKFWRDQLSRGAFS